MKTYAGDLLFELPGSWDNDSTYVYRQPGSDIELRFENSPVAPVAVPEELIDLIVTRLGTLGPVRNLQRGKAKVGGRDAATLGVSCQNEGDSATTLLHALVFKVTPNRAVTITALAPDTRDNRLAIQQAWSTLIASLQVVDFR